MRFSTSLLAAGFTASVFAAPVAQFDPQDECEADPVPSSSSAPLAVASTSTLAPVAPTSSVQASSVVSISASSSSLASPSSSASDVSPIETSSAIPVSTATVVPVEASTSASTTSAASLATSVAAIASSSSSSAGAQSTGTAKNGTLQWFGANESGAEFGTTNIPGVLGTDYTWPNTSAIQTLIDQGMNIFRIPFLMERLAQGTMTATLDATYLAALTTVVDYVTTAGAHAIIDPHNFGRYDGTVFTSTSDFQTFWTNVATEFKTNDNVIFDCNNEFHDEPSNTIVAELNQACIDGVRAAGATTQYIFVEGTSYTGAWTWVSSGNSDAMGNLTDTSDKIIYEMHQYLDSDGSGTSSTCVSSTIGAERVADATAWLIANGKKGIIGEYAGGANSVCQEAITGMLDVLEQNSDVWLGALWWGAGPWWGDYIYGMEPPSGVAYDYYKSVLSAYV